MFCTLLQLMEVGVSGVHGIFVGSALDFANVRVPILLLVIPGSIAQDVTPRWVGVVMVRIDASLFPVMISLKLF